MKADYSYTEHEAHSPILDEKEPDAEGIYKFRTLIVCARKLYFLVFVKLLTPVCIAYTSVWNTF